MSNTSKICDKCKISYSLNKYRRYNENNFSNTCKGCLNEMDKSRKKIARQNRANNTFVKCEKCNEEKSLKNFTKLKKFYKKKICLSCYPLFLREQKTEWCKNEHNTNMNYRIKKSLAARLRTVLDKNNSTMNYIGCNIQYLREWFEYNFTADMNWDNYATFWSIDHIIPVCNFDLTLEDEKLKCWNWSNLMPVTIKYNSSKKKIDINQVKYIVEQLKKFKEEGSTTKWFSSNFILNETEYISEIK
jgi:hypothetical protein